MTDMLDAIERRWDGSGGVWYMSAPGSGVFKEDACADDDMQWLFNEVRRARREEDIYRAMLLVAAPAAVELLDTEEERKGLLPD